MHSINPQQLRRMLDHDEVILIDVREPTEHAEMCIREAHLIPLGQLSYKGLPHHEGKHLVFHCKSGMRSQRACHAILQESMGNLKVYNLEGGIQAWSHAGFPTKKSKTTSWSIERQLQLISSLLILIGLIVGYQYHPYGYIVTALVGVGTLVRATTGWCGMYKWLSKMPWNRP